MSLAERVIKNLEVRRERIINGEINCIPFPFSRFRDDIPGIEQGRYYIITGATKSSKTQFASYWGVFHPILYAYAHPEQISVKIFYAPLEETKEAILERFMSFLLHIKEKIRISPTDLRSTREDKVLDMEVLDILKREEFTKIISFFEQSIVWISSTNPTGINKELKAYAEANGVIHTKDAKYKDDFGVVQETKAFDYYEPNNPKEYRIVFLDHISLLTIEKGMDLRQSMGKMSEYFVKLRNRYKYTIFSIHQQAMFEQTDAFKLEKLTPSIATLADNKAVARDCDMCISSFSPYKYNLKTWLDYDITKFRDNIRFIEVLLNRNGLCNGVLPLIFDGAVNYFRECPLPNDKEGMAKTYDYLGKLRTQKFNKIFLLFSRFYDRITNKTQYPKELQS